MNAWWYLVVFRKFLNVKNLMRKSKPSRIYNVGYMCYAIDEVLEIRLSSGHNRDIKLRNIVFLYKVKQTKSHSVAYNSVNK